MAFVPPKFQPSSKGGMMFVNPPGVANFRALRVESGDQHLYWQPTYQHVLRVEGAFGEFFPQAEFSDNGNQVIFTKYVDKEEVLSQTRALHPGERIPRGEWQRFLETWTNFKRLADRTDIPEDVRNFIFKFGPPSVERYPAAYRIHRPHWYSRSRLFILWGLEPVGGADFVSLSPEQAISEGTARAETDGQETNGIFLRWLKILLFGLLALALLLLLLWCLLPRPVVDFEVTAEAEKPATTRNMTSLDRSLKCGATEYLWNFEKAYPDSSVEIEPKPTWLRAGPYEVTLQATQSILWGLLYKTDAKTLTLTVAEPPKPPVLILPPVVVIPGVPVLSGREIAKPNAPRNDGSTEKLPDGVLPNGKMVSEGKVTPDGKMVPGSHGLIGPKSDADSEKNPVASSSSGKMESEGKVAPDGKMAPLTPGSPAPRSDADAQKNPLVPTPPGKVESNGKMVPGVPSPPVPKSDADAEKKLVAPSSPGKMESEGKPLPDRKMAPGAAGSAVPKPGTDTEKDQAMPNPTPRPETAPEGKLIPLPKTPAPAPGQPTPLPHVEIDQATALADGKSQDIEFSLKLPKGLKLEHLAIDGVEATVAEDGSFRLRLPLGPHALHIEYGSSTSDLHGQVTQELMVDSDQVKVIRPKTRIAPPVKVPSVEPAAPASDKPKETPAEIFNKKTA